MQVTPITIRNSLLQNMQTQYQTINQLQEEESTGQSFQVPSDNPQAATSTMSLNAALTETTAYSTAATSAQNWLDVTGGALQNMQQLWQTMLSVTVQASSNSLTSTDRDALAQEVQQAQTSFGQLLNTQYEGTYIFGGYSSQTAPVPPAPGSMPAGYTVSSIMLPSGTTLTSAGAAITLVPGAIITPPPSSTAMPTSGTSLTLPPGTTITLPSGSTTTLSSSATMPLAGTSVTSAMSNAAGTTISTINSSGLTPLSETVLPSGGQPTVFQIGQNAQVTINLTGNENAGQPTGSNYLQTAYSALGQLAQAITGGASASQAMLPALQADEGYLSTAQSIVGGRMQRVTQAQGQLTTLAQNLNQTIAQVSGANMTAVTVQLTQEEQAYQAALQSGAQILSVSLLNYIHP